MVKKLFKYTHVGRLPEDWDCLQAIEVIDEISMGPFGSDITVSNFVSSGVPVLNGYNVSQIMLIDKFQNFVTPKKAKKLKKAVAHRGDIIVTHRGTIGQVSYIPDSSAYSEYVISQSQFRVHFNDKRVNSHFLVSYLLSPIGQKYLLETKGHTGVPALAQPTTNFRRLWIPLPEIAEQVAIAEALSDVDSLISSLQKLIEKKRAIKQGTMQELLTGKKRLPGFSVEWSQAPFGDLFDFLPTNAFTRDQMTDTGTIQNVHYGDILTKYGACLDMANTDVPYLLESVSVRKYSESSHVREGDVIIADTAEDSTVGKCVEIVNVHGKVLSGQHTMLCRPKIAFAPKFLGYYMNAECFHNQKLEDSLEALRALCEPVAPPKDMVDYYHYFCGANTEAFDLDELEENMPKREQLYNLSATALRAFGEVSGELQEKYHYTVEQIKALEREVTYYIKVRDDVRLASGDYVDLKKYDPDMRHLIDTYLSADPSRVLTSFGGATLVEMLVDNGISALKDMPASTPKEQEAVAETIENNIGKENAGLYERVI